MMINNKFLCALCVICGGILSSCERRELTYNNEIEIRIAIDWGRAGLETESDYGATVLFYPQTGEAPQVVLLGDRTQGIARLCAGLYNVVVFNRSFDDFSGIAFRGIENFATLEAYARKVESRADSRFIVNPPEVLAVDVMENFEVTDEMVELYQNTRTRADALPTFTPHRLTRSITVNVAIENLNSVREATCTLDNLPLSVFLATGKLATESVSHEFSLKNTTSLYGSTTDGTMTGMLNAFGFDINTPHSMSLTALLIDGRTVVRQEIGEIKAREEEESGSVTLYIDAVAPEPMPDIKVDGGMDAEVGDWGKEENTELPI